MIMSIKELIASRELMTSIKELTSSTESRLVFEFHKDAKALWVSQGADRAEVNKLLDLHKKLYDTKRLPKNEIIIDVLAKNVSFDDFSNLMLKYVRDISDTKVREWGDLLRNNKIAENDEWVVYAINSAEESYLFKGQVKWCLAKGELCEVDWSFYNCFENSSFAVIIRKAPRVDDFDIIMSEHNFKRGETFYWAKSGKVYRSIPYLNIPKFKIPTLDEKLRVKEKLEKDRNEAEFNRFISELIDNGDGTYSSEGDVWIPNSAVENGRLKIKFKKIGGNFSYGYNNNLTTLEGAPQYVGGDFDCFNRSLTSLKGAPQYVGGDFDCSHNKLTSLKGAPQKVGGSFYCNNNKLTTLEDAPQYVGGNFECENNNLTTLECAPRRVGGRFNCSRNNLTTLRHAPQYVGGGFNCSDNNLTTLEGAPQEVVGFFGCSRNLRLKSLDGIGKVGDDFICYDNPNLTSLGGIGEVGGKICSDLS